MCGYILMKEVERLQLETLIPLINRQLKIDRKSFLTTNCYSVQYLFYGLSLKNNLLNKCSIPQRYFLPI
jgi:hypothetical protein